MHEDLVWLARNLKLEVTEYSKLLYSPKGDGGGGNDDDDGGGSGGGGAGSGAGGGSEFIPSF